MITEHVTLQIMPERTADFEAAMPEGASNVRLMKGHENPEKYLLLIDWESVDHHVAFTKEPGIDDFRSLIGEFMAGKPAMEHFQTV
jgi:quinol monooxygenase YgiN